MHSCRQPRVDGPGEGPRLLGRAFCWPLIGGPCVRPRSPSPSGRRVIRWQPSPVGPDVLTAGGPGAPTYLAPGSDPSVLPGPVLVADKLNNRLLIVDPQGHVRWTWPQPGDLAPGQTFLVPDDAFFSPDGRYIIATQEDDFVISVIDIATGKIVWRYGHPGVRRLGPGLPLEPRRRHDPA